mmetsp:Transcript_67916/g.153685  ORF Transcript_67916/g.153685 Transcript_67916/m.153685 type:complete len:282 (-) Transcript_67916:76-921(-)
MRHAAPGPQVRLERAEVGEAGELELTVQQVHHPLVPQHQRHVVHVRNVVHREYVVRCDVAKEGDLVAGLLEEFVGGPADDQVGAQAHRTKLLHTVLRRLRLLLSVGSEAGDERDVDEAHVLPADAELELPERLEEDHTLDVAHRAAHLDQAHVRGLPRRVHRHRRHPLHPVHDLGRDVRNHLDGLAEVVAAPLLVDHRLVHLSRRDVVVLRQVHVQKTLVVTQVEVGLSAVVEDEALAVLKGRHGARVHIQVGVDLDRRRRQAARLEKPADTGNCDALPET